MACIYTGAVVWFADYDAFAVGDLFQVGNQVLIQWEPASWRYQHELEAPTMPTHTAKIGFGYHHDKRGITVTNESNVIGERR